jgi:toxin-antitoxin system PIN domain toxin
VSSTVDANLLVYASNEGDPVHAPARALLEELARGPELLYLFWPAIMGYLRIVTHPSILPRPLAPPVAIANVGALLERPHVRAPGEGGEFWARFRAAARSDSRGNAIPDAHVVALMREHEVGLIYTRDRDFRRYDGITAHDPFE